MTYPKLALDASETWRAGGHVLENRNHLRNGKKNISAANSSFSTLTDLQHHPHPDQYVSPGCVEKYIDSISLQNIVNLFMLFSHGRLSMFPCHI